MQCVRLSLLQSRLSVATMHYSLSYNLLQDKAWSYLRGLRIHPIHEMLVKIFRTVKIMLQNIWRLEHGQKLFEMSGKAIWCL